MPAVDEITSSWAEEVEGVGEPLPQSTETVEDGLKIITEYKRDDDDKKVKIIRTYKVEKRNVLKSIALRKTWTKYGFAANDKPGPNPANTIIVNEEVFMQFGEELEKPEEDAFDKLKNMANEKTVHCRTCNGMGHWTLKCPFKDTELGKIIEEQKKTQKSSTTTPAVEEKKPGKYLPPSMREGANKRGESMTTRRDEAYPIRISNLSESTQDADLDELVKPFGAYSKIYLAKDKNTGLCKGFAYVHFKSKHDAQAAISRLHRHGYDNLLLNVDWSKPQSDKN